MAGQAYTPRRTAWSVTWNAWGLGVSGKTKPDLKLTLTPIKRGTTGPFVLGDWISNVDGLINCEIKDIDRVIQEKLIPWFSGVSGTDSIPIIPTGLNTNLYTYAQELILHPVDMGSSTIQDIHITKAVPLSCVNLERDGDHDDVWNATFKAYPDVSQITATTPAVKYGYIGNIAI